MTYVVKATDTHNNTSIMSEHKDEDDAREHEEQLRRAYPLFHIWTEVLNDEC